MVLKLRAVTQYCTHICFFLLVDFEWKFSPLDGFDEEVFFFARSKVWPHDTYFLSSGHTPREDASKGVETAFVSGWDHLGDVHHQRSLGVTVLNTFEGFKHISVKKRCSCQPTKDVRSCGKRHTDPWRPRRLQDLRRATHSDTSAQ